VSIRKFLEVELLHLNVNGSNASQSIRCLLQIGVVLIYLDLFIFLVLDIYYLLSSSEQMGISLASEVFSVSPAHISADISKNLLAILVCTLFVFIWIAVGLD